LEDEWKQNGEGIKRGEMSLQGEDESRRSSPP